MVIGAGVAGLFAAAACRGAGCPVVILERDHLDRPGPRAGVPQGSQPHVYLLRGLRAAEELVPGLTDDLRAAGARPFDTAAAAWRAERGWYPTGGRPFEVLSLTRPLFESELRRRVLGLGVDLRTGARVTQLARAAGQRWLVGRDGADPVTADLVVDTSGRSTRILTWLDALGVPRPAVEHIDGRVGYATRMFVDAPDLGGRSGIVLLASPQRPVGAAVLPVENDRWLVGLGGYGDQRPPRDEAGFTAFAGRLVDPCVADFMAAARPCGAVSIHRQTANRHHHFERIRRWPAGLLPLGDAFVCFNPIYGQGITVAAAQALQLRDALRRAPGMPDSGTLIRRFAAVARLPWQIATGQDLRQPACPGHPSRLGALTNRWVLTVQDLAVHGDLRALAALNRLYHLTASPTVLAHPALVAGAIRAALFGAGQATTRPLELP